MTSLTTLPTSPGAGLERTLPSAYDGLATAPDFRFFKTVHTARRTALKGAS